MTRTDHRLHHLPEPPANAAVDKPPRTPESRAQAIRAMIPSLRKLLGDRYVLSRPEELSVYECDACTLVKAAPELVVLPRSTEEVAEVVKLCLQNDVPYIARGSGTGLSGGALPVEGGVIIGLNRMDRILDINVEQRTATVEVGVINAWLNEALKPFDLFYAPDPSSQSACTIGGNVAENAGGIHCIKYGVTVDHILSLEVVLPNGTVANIGNNTRRTQGLNLVGLMVGSEGTLGIVTRATVRLLKKPDKVRVYLAAFDRLRDSTAAVSQIIRDGLLPSALEFMDAFTVKAVNDAFSVGFPETSEAVLLIEFDGYASQILHDELKLKAILEKHRVTQIRIGETETERKALWAARKGAVAAYGRYLPAFYLHDCVIPRSQLTYVLEKITEIGKRYQLPVGNVFHAGDGNLHPNLLFDPENPEMIARTLQAGEEILAVCLSVGGTLSGEHGIGIEKSQYMDRQFRVADLARMLLVKNIFDPRALANPSKIFPARKGCGEVSHNANHFIGTHAMPASEGLWI